MKRKPKLRIRFLSGTTPLFLLASFILIKVTSSFITTMNTEQDNVSKLINKGITFKFSDSQNFNDIDLSQWFESSDTVRQPGTSKATLTLQKLNKECVGVDQRAVLFALLNPQPNGAGFAGMKRLLNATDFQDIL